MGKSTYSELLKDPKWQKKRLDILNRDNFRCCQCGSVKNTLHVHHQYYIKGNMPWEYPDDSLITLCEFCHEVVDNYNWHTAFLNLRLTPKQLLELAICMKHYLQSRQKDHDTSEPKSKYNFTPDFHFMIPWVTVIEQDEFDEYYNSFRDEAIKPYLNEQK
jgi:hypothetical protein